MWAWLGVGAKEAGPSFKERYGLRPLRLNYPSGRNQEEGSPPKKTDGSER